MVVPQTKVLKNNTKITSPFKNWGTPSKIKQGEALPPAFKKRRKKKAEN